MEGPGNKIGQDVLNSEWVQTNIQHLCRLCAKKNDDLIPIFKGEGIEYQLKPKIDSHLPIKVNENDALPTQMCYDCASALLAWHELVENCLQAENKLNTLITHQNKNVLESIKCDDSNSFAENISGTDAEGEDENIVPIISENRSSGTTEYTDKSTQPVKKRLRSTSQNHDLSEEIFEKTVKEEQSKTKCLMFKEFLLVSQLPRNAKFCAYCGENVENYPQLCKHVIHSHFIHIKRRNKHDGEYVYSNNLELLEHLRLNHQHKNTKFQIQTITYFKCDACSKVFETIDSLEDHLLSVHGIKDTDDSKNCINRACIIVSDAQNQLQKPSNEILSCHSKNVHLVKKLNYCEESAEDNNYDVSTMVQVEIDSNSNDSSIINSLSDNTVENLDRAKENGSEPPSTSDVKNFTCNICSNSYIRNSDLMRHIKKMHNKAEKVNEKNRYKCVNCLRTFTKKSTLKEHQKIEHDYVIHRRSDSVDGIDLNLIMKAEREVNGKLVYHCELCMKYIKTQRGYANHIRMHTGERPFTCHMCGMQYRTSHSLKRHLRCVHEGIKEHNCDICGRSFAEKGARDNHRRSHTGEKPYVCHVCGKAFPTANCIYLHRRIHTDYRPHQCSFCDKKFRKRQVLILHIRTHTGEKPYSCTICNKSFKARNEMKRHMTVHSTDKPFSCTHCGICFGQARYLKNHIKSHHNCSE